MESVWSEDLEDKLIDLRQQYECLYQVKTAGSYRNRQKKRTAVEAVGSRRELVANSCTHRRRRRDATRQFRRVGVGGVNWALDTHMISVDRPYFYGLLTSAEEWRRILLWQETVWGSKESCSQSHEPDSISLEVVSYVWYNIRLHVLAVNCRR